MRRLVLLTILISNFYTGLGQESRNQLANINTIVDAEEFIHSNPSSVANLISIESSRDTSAILRSLYSEKSGFTFSIGRSNYKILKIDSVLSFRVLYIFLSGEIYTKPQVDSIRKEMISKFKSGTRFYDLVYEYNIDQNFAGDTGWFTENMMVKEFENAVKAHKLHDIFTVDTPEKKWYHVVWKTYPDTYIKTVTMIQIKTEK